MTQKQTVFSLIVGFVIFFFVLNLIRKRKLREEYSWLWFLMAIIVFILISWYGLLEKISTLIGARVVTSALFIFAILFLIALSIQFSVEISELSRKVKNLSQELSIQKAKKRKSRKK